MFKSFKTFAGKRQFKSSMFKVNALRIFHWFQSFKSRTLITGHFAFR